ncbi:FIST N-terminal domain-containing protein [Vibrio sp. SCSIO 43136]|uniref:FIST signal transduction protein n=1 Tax=Vibrio sp. SCSIO 43136 TaxID=2819101 RepID=UPI002075E5DE|nr:FIST N-terminal domain-containing protein [Vibrio sp. SCSIO 43136]USD66542.1 FIST C-terminal domain-containing protein [Vibrio sp. SCSIO 43136]
MEFFSTYSTNREEASAVSEVFESLSSRGLPTLLVCYYTEEYSAHRLQAEFSQQFTDVPIIGCSTFQGLLTDKGFLPGAALGVMAIYDSTDAAYGVEVSTLEHEYIQGAATKCLQQAIQNAHRYGEQPDLIILHSTSGYEEHAVKEIQQEFGTQVPLIGGTAADNEIIGNWSLFNQTDACQSGIGIAVLYPSQNVSLDYHSGYTASAVSGVVTKCVDREVVEIDHKPAIDVYARWVRMITDKNLSTEELFKTSNSTPFGRLRNHTSETPQFDLIHPVKPTSCGGIQTFVTVQEGDRLHLMQGSRERLMHRAERVAKSARDNATPGHRVLGAIGSFCAGSMLNLGEDLDGVAKRLALSLNQRPYISPFSFGEQGCFDGESNSHANLMISAAIFYEDTNG